MQKKLFPAEDWKALAAEFLVLGLLGGLLSHAVFLAVLSQSFFPDTFNLMVHLGHMLPLQLGISTVFCFYACAALRLEKKS